MLYKLPLYESLGIGYLLLLSFPLFGEKEADLSHEIAVWSQELAHVIKAEAEIEEKSIPQLNGLFKEERKSLLLMNLEVLKVVLAYRRAFLEMKIALAKAQAYPLRLMEAWTHFAYILSIVIAFLGGTLVVYFWILIYKASND